MKENFNIQCFLYLPESQKRIYESYFAKHQNIYIKEHNLGEKNILKRLVRAVFYY